MHQRSVQQLSRCAGRSCDVGEGGGCGDGGGGGCSIRFGNRVLNIKSPTDD